MSRSAPRQSEPVASALAALHDIALLAAAFHAPILWGQVSIPETHSSGGVSSSGGQVLAAALVGLALICAALSRWAQRRPPARLPNAIHLPALVFLAVVAASAVTSVNRHVSAIELARLATGAAAFFLVANRALLPQSRANVVAAGFACSVVLTLFIPVPGEAGLVIKMLAVIALGVAVAMIATRQRAGGDDDPVGWWRSALILSTALVVALYGWHEKVAVARQLNDPTWQIFSTFFNPNPLGGYLAMIFPLALAAALADRVLARRLLWGFCAVALAATIIPTKSKGSMLSLAVAGVVCALLLMLQSRRWRRLAVGAVAALLVAVVVGGGLTWLVEPVRHRLADIAGVESAPNMFRILTWRGTIRLAAAYPWLGAGPSAFKYVYPNYAIAGYVEAAHQNYLQMFAEIGLVGGAAFLWLLGAVLFTGRRAIAAAGDFEGRALAIGGIGCIAALLAHSFFDYDWYIGATNLTFWLVAGFLASQAHTARPAAAPPAPADPPRGKRSRQARPAPAPTPAGEAAERLLPWPAAGRAQGVPFGLAWLGLCAVAVSLTYLGVRVPLRNALAQHAIDQGDARAMSGAGAQAAALVLDSYDRARRFDPWWAEAWERYGMVLGTVRGMEAGIEALDRAVSLSPTSFRAHTSKAQLYEHFGRFDDATRAYEEALRLFPHHTRTMKRLAEVRQKAGDAEGALAVYERLAAGEHAPHNRYRALSDVDVDTNFAFAHYEIGRAAQRAHERGERGALARALEQYNQALGIIAEYFERAKRTDEMFLLLKRPREYRAEDMKMLEAKTRWRMADVYRRVGDQEQADRERRRGLGIWPGVESAVAAEDAS